MVIFVFLLDFRIVQTVWYFFVFLLDFEIVQTVWYFFCLLDFRTVQTVWYFLFFCWILEFFRQCGIFCRSFHSYLHIYLIYANTTWKIEWKNWKPMKNNWNHLDIVRLSTVTFWFILFTEKYLYNKMKSKKYHTVWTILKSNRKTKNTTLSEQF